MTDRNAKLIAAPDHSQIGGAPFEERCERAAMWIYVSVILPILKEGCITGVAAAEDLVHAMAKGELRRDRYNIIGLDAEVFSEVCVLLQPRNELTWVRGGFDPPQMQFDFNGLWFDAPFTMLRS